MIGLAGLVPLVPIVAAVILISSSSTQAASRTLIHPFTTPTTAPSTKVAAAPRPVGSEVAVVIHPTEMDATPGGAQVAAQGLRTSFGGPSVLLVRKTVGSWLGVLSPVVGNGKLGWISRSAVDITYVNWSLKVSLSRFQLTVLEGTKVMKRYTIAIGRPTAPTPTGTFAVTDRLTTGDPEGPYGCCILALSAVAPHAIQDWDGGDRIAIHSTPPDTYDQIGQPISHGCMHVTLPEGQWLIDHIPLGTPVYIRT